MIASTSSAAVTNWTNADAGDSFWGTAGNWDTGVPTGGANDAVFGASLAVGNPTLNNTTFSFETLTLQAAGGTVNSGSGQLRPGIGVAAGGTIITSQGAGVNTFNSYVNIQGSTDTQRHINAAADNTLHFAGGTGNVTLDDNAAMQINIGNAQGINSALALGGTSNPLLDIGTGVAFDLVGASPFPAPGFYTLATFNTPNLGTFDSITYNGLINAKLAVSYNADSIVLQVIPEPATGLLLATGLLIVFTRSSSRRFNDSS